MPQSSVVDVDPEDPAQTLDDTGQFHIHPLDVEAQPRAEADEDLDIAEAETAGDTEDGEDADYVHDTGELYGVRTPHAGDPALSAPEDRDSFEGTDRGETWLESLETHAAESGPAPEEEVVVIDDSDTEHPDHRGHHATERGDRPVADKGSGGPAGL